MQYTVAYITPEHEQAVAMFLTRPSAEKHARGLWRMSLLPGGVKGATDVVVTSKWSGSRWSARARTFLRPIADPVPAATPWVIA